MPECLICQERFGGGLGINEADDFATNASVDKLKAVVTKCGHLFHQGCISVWMQQKGSQVACPMCNTKLGSFKPIPIYTDWGEAPALENRFSDMGTHKLIEATRKLNETKIKIAALLQEKKEIEIEYENQLALLQEQIRRRNECVIELSQKNIYQERLIKKAEDSIIRLKKEKKILHDALLDAKAQLPKRTIDYKDKPMNKVRLISELSPPFYLSRPYQTTEPKVIDLRSNSSPEIVDKSWSSLYDTNSEVVDLSLSDVEDLSSIL